MDLARRTHGQSAKRWALALTQQPSVTGTADEAAFAPWLAEALKRDPAFARRAEIWTIPVAEQDPRACVAMLVRGRGRRTVILTGHFDTVSVADYGDLAPIATEPEALADALRTRLALKAETAAERRAQRDLATDDYLPGRGLLDMKAGLAAGLAVIEAFANHPDSPGSLLFIAVPDEENNSAGARAAARELPALAARFDLDLAAAINLDSIADDGDGEAGRVLALGTVGKLLPTVYVAGAPTHSGFPLNGLNAAPLAGAIAARLEWAAELTEPTPHGPGAPPSVLGLKDAKAGYDVTTPAATFLILNVLLYRRSPQEVMAAVRQLTESAVGAHLAELAARTGATPPSVSVHLYGDVVAAACARDAQAGPALQTLAAELARSATTLPEQCRLLTERAWSLSGLAGPAVVLGFGSMPYLATNLSASPEAAALREAAEAVARDAPSRHGVSVRLAEYFAGISDMSFFGEADESGLELVARNTPAWESAVRWPAKAGIANLPTVNLGPWGRDYHTPLERLHVGYAFETLPRLLADLIEAVLGHTAEKAP